MPGSAILYVRISELTEATTSPERQLADCQAYCQRMGWAEVARYEDLDISGTKTLAQRPGLTAALEAIARGEADHLVAAKIDRVARSVITFNQVVQALQRHGASLVSVAEGLDFSTPAGRMVANVLAVFAQFESEQIGSRVKNAKAHLASIGKWPGGRRPFGWSPVAHPDGKGFRLEVDPVEGPIIQGMVEAVLEGISVGTIAGDLNKRGIPTVLGHSWVGETVRKALTKPAMIGGNGADRLVSDRTYASLQARLQRGAPVEARHDHDEVLLAPSLVRCGRCGSPMRPGTHDDGRRVYRCSQRPAPGVGGCFLIASAPQVDTLVEGLLLERLGALPVALAGEAETVDPAASERADILERMGQLEEDRYIRGLFGGAEGDARFQRIYASLEALLGDLPEPYTVETEGETLPTGGRFQEAWEEADVETRRGWVALAISSVAIAPGRGGRRLDPARLTVTWAS
jgi:site-specific DNA recombinase